MQASTNKRPDYSNLPSRVDFLFLIMSCILFFISLKLHVNYGETLFIICLFFSELFLLAFAALAYQNTIGARRVCKLMVAEASTILTGSENILDVCTGSGMLLIALAKCLNKGGIAHGVDVWESTVKRGKSDKSTRTDKLVYTNAMLEGVGDRVRVLGGDPRNLPYKSDYFDLVVSMKLFHHMSAGSVDRTLIHMVRVLRNGGYLYIHDFWHLHRIQKQLTRFGMIPIKVVQSSTFFPLAKFLVFKKPDNGLPESIDEIDTVQKQEARKQAFARNAGVHLESLSKEQAAELEKIRQARKAQQ